MEELWQVEEIDKKSNFSQLANDLNIPPLISKLLIQRKILTEENALKFFQSKFSDIYSPFLMKDMNIAVQRILKSIQAKKRISLLGDYDVDGTTGLAILFKGLKRINADVHFIISNRITEGYGLNKSVLKRIIDSKPDLLITVDCSISSNDEVAMAKSHAIDTIVCDHHSIHERIEDVFAILNPKQLECEYPYKDLCGCGIALLLILALFEKKKIQLDLNDSLIQYAAIGTIADHVPLTGINRIITYFGIEAMNNKPVMMIQTLRTQIPLKGVITSKTILFTIAPRLNSPGRIHDAVLSVQFLLEDDENKSKILALDVEQINLERRKLVNKALYQLEDRIKSDKSLIENNHICILNENWHPGIIAILASFLAEKYAKASFVFTEEHGYYKASIRSNVNIDLFELLDENKELLIEYGGHKFAAGLSIEMKNFESFKERLNAAFNHYKQIEIEKKIRPIDAEINFKDINSRFLRLIKLFEPFGYQNKRPLFLAKNLILINEPIVLQNRHLKFKLRQDLIEFEVIAFNKKELLADLIEKRGNLSAIFYLNENRWLDKQTIQLELVGIK